MTAGHEPQATCAYCGHTAPVAELEPFNQAGNMACRDNGACLGRQAAQELPRALEEARSSANAARLMAGNIRVTDLAYRVDVIDHLLWRMGIAGAQRHEEMEA